MGIKLIALTIGVLSLSVSAQACDTARNLPGQNIDLYFEKNSTQISSDQTLKMANWAIDMRLKYPIQEVLSVRGLAEANEREPGKLALQRADKAKAMLMQFGLTQVEYDIHGAIYRPLVHYVELPETIRRVEIELSPGCPNNCCDGE
ncbi:hypothetical protein [Paraburkholderia sp. ZP32-5]|uniref:hypothetical protein n=1 Tax=Paraburkholderia sp. ZP32-5 TaxID=2883245 RepID=UPI001F37AC9E|nr:hypothetical protein [Paraburkholderia sp. ZP32-5]